jgi:ribose/xylose/arabinose/galactoside ABC-type transport system permease subunit
MKAKHKMLLAVLAAIVIGGCSTGGGTKATSRYPVTTFVDPVTEEVPHVTVD